MMFHYQICLDCSRMRVRKLGQSEWSDWHNARELFDTAKREGHILESAGRTVCPNCDAMQKTRAKEFSSPR